MQRVLIILFNLHSDTWNLLPLGWNDGPGQGTHITGLGNMYINSSKLVYQEYMMPKFRQNIDRPIMSSY